MTVVLFVIVLAILVLIHELGHFLAAKKNGVKVEEFGFGFPPRLFGIKHGETLYSINLIPLGGFVKLKGETGEDKTDHDSFANKKFLVKALILLSGVIMNFLLAWTLISVGLAIGLPVPVEEAQLSAGAHIGPSNIQIASVLPDSPASKAQVQPGDIVLEVNGAHYDKIEDLQSAINASDSQPLALEVKRGNDTLNFTLTPQMFPSINRYAIGVGLVETATVSFPWYTAIYEGLNRTLFATKEIFVSFYQLIHDLVFGKQVSSELSGPVGIAIITGQVAKLGIVYLMQFMAILSLNLAVINFLPFPALDGGRLFFVIIEKVRGRPVSRKLENVVHNIGFIFLIILMILVTIGDIGHYGAGLLGH